MSVSTAQLRRGFGPIYRYLSRCGVGLSTPAKMVLLNLLERQGQDECAWPEQMTISEDTGFSAVTIRKAIAELGQRGFVAQQRRGLGQSNVYSVHIEAVLDWAESGLRSRTKVAFDQERNELTFPKEEIPREVSQTEEVVLSEPPKRKSKSLPHRPFDDDAEALLREKYPGHPDFDTAVRKAMRSPGYQFTPDKFGAVDDWLAEDMKRAAERRQGNGRNNHNPSRKAAEVAGLAGFD